MTTREELKAKSKEKEDILRIIKNITDNLEDGELTLTDIVAEEESLYNRCEELKDIMKEIVSLRQWLDFEECDMRRGIF